MHSDAETAQEHTDRLDVLPFTKRVAEIYRQTPALELRRRALVELHDAGVISDLVFIQSVSEGSTHAR